MLLREDENFDVRDGEHLAELIRQVSPEMPTSMARQERDAEAAKEKQHRDVILRKGEEVRHQDRLASSSQIRIARLCYDGRTQPEGSRSA